MCTFPLCHSCVSILTPQVAQVFGYNLTINSHRVGPGAHSHAVAAGDNQDEQQQQQQQHVVELVPLQADLQEAGAAPVMLKKQSSGTKRTRVLVSSLLLLLAVCHVFLLYA